MKKIIKIIETKCKSEKECRLHLNEPTASLSFTLYFIKLITTIYYEKNDR